MDRQREGKGAVTSENGRIINPCLSQYRVTRLPDVPDIEGSWFSIAGVSR